MPKPRLKFIPPTHNPDDCVCGCASPDVDFQPTRLFACPACDGVTVSHMPTERERDAD